MLLCSYTPKKTKTNKIKNTPDLGRHVEHQRYNGGVVVAIDDKAHFVQSSAEVGGVLWKLSEAIGTWKR